jgi:cytochrome c6
MKKKIIAILLTVSVGFLVASITPPASAKKNWDEHCARCHGADGKGDTRMGQRMNAKDYTDPKVQAEMKDEAAFKAVKEGFKDAGGKTLMKPYDQLTDEEIKDLVKYMRTFDKSKK